MSHLCPATPYYFLFIKRGFSVWNHRLAEEVQVGRSFHVLKVSFLFPQLRRSEGKGAELSGTPASLRSYSGGSALP